MAAQLQMTLAENAQLNYKKASNLQGVLFEHINREYARRLHEQSLHPYSQYLCRRGGKTIWIVSTLDDSAFHEIILPLTDPSFQSFTLKHRTPVNVKILNKEMRMTDEEEDLDIYYHADLPGKLCVDFVTPTAFKQRGRYYIFPDLRLVYQSILLRYKENVDPQLDVSEELLQSMSDCTDIVQYRLRTVRQPLEGVNIPGFTGSMTIRFHGSRDTVYFIQSMLRFGMFSGVGIKTGMGMGGIQIHS